MKSNRALRHCQSMRRHFLAGALVLTGALAAPTQAQAVAWPSPEWPSAKPADVGLDAAKLEEARDYALSAGGSGMIVRHGKVVLRWVDVAFRLSTAGAGNHPQRRRDCGRKSQRRWQNS